MVELDGTACGHCSWPSFLRSNRLRFLLRCRKRSHQGDPKARRHPSSFCLSWTRISPCAPTSWTKLSTAEGPRSSWNLWPPPSPLASAQKNSSSQAPATLHFLLLLCLWLLLGVCFLFRKKIQVHLLKARQQSGENCCWPPFWLKPLGLVPPRPRCFPVRPPRRQTTGSCSLENRAHACWSDFPIRRDGQKQLLHQGLAQSQWKVDCHHLPRLARGMFLSRLGKQATTTSLPNPSTFQPANATAPPAASHKRRNSFCPDMAPRVPPWTQKSWMKAHQPHMPQVQEYVIYIYIYIHNIKPLYAIIFKEARPETDFVQVRSSGISSVDDVLPFFGVKSDCWWCQSQMEVPWNGGTQNGWFIRENSIQMDDLGVPLF